MNVFRRVVLALGLLACAATFAQPVTGVSNINVGISEEEFLSSPALQGMKLMDMGWKFNRLGSGEIWRTKSGSRPQGKEEKVFGEKTAKYIFLLQLFPNPYQSSALAALGMSRLNVFFYEGKLASIEVVGPPSNDSLLETLQAKYGEPRLINGMKTETCQNDFGAQFTHDKGTLLYRWGEGKPTVAEYLITKWDCGNSDREYRVFDKVSYNKLRSEESRLLEAEKASELKQKSQNTPF